MMGFRELWDEITPIGRTGNGYLRYAWSDADLALREWFRAQAASRGLDVEQDGNGNLFAWWGPRDGQAVLTGSHFDSVPHGGGYDGPLGIVSGFLALDELRARGVQPRRGIGVAAFVEEEGSRFGVACLGSRLLTGSIDVEQALALRDGEGASLAEVQDGQLGPRPDLVERIGAFVELHIEQGRALADVDVPVGVGNRIWPHGRWRLEVTGEGNHAGTTGMADRRDPMLTLAFAVLAANKEARLRGAHATVGRVSVDPNATNAVAARASAWLDARADSADILDGLVTGIKTKVEDRAGRDGTRLVISEESVSQAVEFDASLVELCGRFVPGKALPTAAGHDAGILAAHVPTVMLFVRNPTGVSHAPAEHATDADCEAGIAALADVLQELAVSVSDLGSEPSLQEWRLRAREQAP
jgi:beta-ureidopropionase / N-carbamoyl-L-amino-acid hydrolase